MGDRQKKILWVVGIVVLVLNLLVFGWLLSDLFTDVDDLPETGSVTMENTKEETTEATEASETEMSSTQEVTTKAPETEGPTTEVPTTLESTTEETTTETVVIEPGNIHLEETVMATDELVQVLPLDKTMLVDLDGDGVLEKLTVREGEDSRGYGQDKFHFQINELYYHGTAGFWEILPGGYLTPYGIPFYLIDIDTSDSYKEIAIYKEAMGEATYIFRYQKGELIPIGTAEGVPGVEKNEMGQLCVNGDGTLNAMSRYDVLHPSVITKTWKLMNSHLFHASLENVIPEYYEFELHPADRKMVLKQAMVFYAERNGSPDELITLPAGTKIDIARFYPDGEWVQILYEEDKKAVWLKQVGYNLILPMNIFESEMMEYIEGLNLAG